MHDPERDIDRSTTLADLAARVTAIETHLGLAALAVPVDPAPAADEPEPATPGPPSESLLPSLGIALLMLAGAFLLRAFTGSGTLADPVGVSLGIAYVAVLLALTDHSARQDRRTRAHLFGVSTVLVAYPFIWETSTKLELLAPPAAAIILAVLVAVGVALSLRRALPILAWIHLVAAVVVSAGLFWRTDAPEVFLALVVALGAATVWLGYLRDWRGPRWLVAVVANFLVFLTVMMAAHPDKRAPGRPDPDPDAAFLLAVALPAVYLASFAWQTLVRRREAGGFEILQSLGCIMAGYVGAIHLLLVNDRSTAALGWVTLVAGVAGYVVAFLLVRGRQGRGLNFFYYAWLGLLLMLIGSSLVVSPGLLPFLWCGLAVAAAVTGGVYDRWTLRLHCAAYLIGAAVVSGLLAAAFAAFAGSSVPTWSDGTVPGLVVWLVAVVCYALLVAAQRGGNISRWRRTPRFLTAALALIGAGILLVITLAGWLAALRPDSGAAVVAAVRTAVVAGSAILLAVVGRRASLAELAWFAGPLLGLAAVKILLEDLRQGTPISLFVSFACFGVALILEPHCADAPRPQTPREIMAAKRPSYRHATRLFLVIGIALILAVIVRSQLVPDTFGDKGHFRADAVVEARQFEPRHLGRAICGECHDDVFALHAKDAHAGIECEACHGPGVVHVAAEGEGGIILPDGKRECLVCHELMLARPGEFAQVVPQEHFDFVGVGDPATECVACHDPHEPLFMDRDLRTARLHPLIHRCRDCHTGRIDESLDRPDGHPAIFECNYCHADVVAGFATRPHAGVRCTACHLFFQDSDFAGRMVRDTDPRFCLLCHRDAEFRSDDAPPSVDWPEHREVMAETDADLDKRCSDCHQDRIHPLQTSAAGQE